MRRLIAYTLIAVVAAGSAQAQSDHYINSRGHSVRRPMHSNHVPRGASAHCRDGTYSFSENRRGTCSHHGGVAVWL
jgi:hypothetical protein